MTRCALPASLARRWVLACLAAGACAGSSPAAQAAEINLCIVGKDNWLFSAFDDIRRSTPATVAKVVQTISAAAGILHDAKIGVALSFLPAKARVYREFLPDDLGFTPEADARYRTALDALRPSGAVLFDGAAFFAAVRRTQPSTDLYFRADSHWVAVGAAAMAAEMARHITLARILPSSNRPGMALSAPKPVVQEHNDLAALLPLADQARYPFQTYYAREPVAANAQAALLDDDVADTVVIGSSFMQPAYGYAATLSSELGRPVDLVWKVHQFSPYWTLLNYFRSPAFKARPRLIVWNFQEADMETPSDVAGAWGSTAMPPSEFLASLRRLAAA